MLLEPLPKCLIALSHSKSGSIVTSPLISPLHLLNFISLNGTNIHWKHKPRSDPFNFISNVTDIDLTDLSYCERIFPLFFTLQILQLEGDFWSSTVIIPEFTVFPTTYEIKSHLLHLARVAFHIWCASQLCSLDYEHSYKHWTTLILLVTCYFMPLCL